MHEASLTTLRQAVSRSHGSALEPAFLATLPSQALSGLRQVPTSTTSSSSSAPAPAPAPAPELQLQLHHHHLLLHLHLHLLHRLHLSAHVLRQAEAHAREELGATTALLLEQVAMHEVLLEAMYDVHSVAMYDVSRLSPQQVGRHQHRHVATSTATAPPRRPPRPLAPPPPPRPPAPPRRHHDHHHHRHHHRPDACGHASPRGPCVVMQLNSAIHYTPYTIHSTLYSFTAIQLSTACHLGLASRAPRAPHCPPPPTTCTLQYTAYTTVLWQASDRGAHGLGSSPADQCAALATALRAYEAELQLKQASVHDPNPNPNPKL